jgi:hypothetical protein
MPYFDLKIFKICILLDLDLMNNSLHCTNFKFPTEFML